MPAGFTISTEVCTYYYDNKRTYPAALQAQIAAGIGKIEKIMGVKFGDATKFPLLVAVRSGARDSMPGMMDTILNLGLNDETVIALERATQNPRFAWDCYRRFIQMYGDVVLGVQKRAGEDHEPFETVLETYKHETYGNGDLEDNKLTADDLKDDHRSLQGAGEGAHGQGVPGRSVAAARGRGQRRVRLVDERPRDRLSPQVQHPGRVGHRRQRAGDGVRQHR